MQEAVDEGMLPSDTNTPLLVFCAVGGRSQIAKLALEEMGYTTVTNGGGIAAVEGMLGGGAPGSTEDPNAPRLDVERFGHLLGGEDGEGGRGRGGGRVGAWERKEAFLLLVLGLSKAVDPDVDLSNEVHKVKGEEQAEWKGHPLRPYMGALLELLMKDLDMSIPGATASVGPHVQARSRVQVQLQD